MRNFSEMFYARGGRGSFHTTSDPKRSLTGPSFDHLVSAKQNRGWYRNAYRLCGLEVHDELEIRWQLNRQICRFTPPKHLGSDAAYAAVDIKNVRPIRHQPSISRKL